MPTSLFQYEMLPTTWFYVSALMILAIFFRFNRLLSIRNVDLLGVILLGLGLLFYAMNNLQTAFYWIFGLQTLFLIRLFYDTLIVRRPLLEPNLAPSGLRFACIMLLGFMIANLIINRGEQIDSLRSIRLEQLLTLQGEEHPQEAKRRLDETPGYPPFLTFVESANKMVAASPALLQRDLRERHELQKTGIQDELVGQSKENGPRKEGETAKGGETAGFVDVVDQATSLLKEVATLPVQETDLLSSSSQSVDKEMPIKPIVSAATIPAATTPVATTTPTTSTTATPEFLLTLSLIILTHILIVVALIDIGHCHFGNMQTGTAAATVYLLLPYTNQMLARLDIFVPVALILWAIALYRRPLFAASFLAIAANLVFYPIFLIPLWGSFYWKRGYFRFLFGLFIIYTFFLNLLFWNATSYHTFGNQLACMFGKYCFLADDPNGAWEIWNPIYRIPLLALFLVICFGMILWPGRKHLGVLISCSTLIMLSVQFWQPYGGGLYMGWYLPLLLLVIFRPNLEDRIALTTVRERRYFF
ncbi:MAG: hypothetical protein ACRC10_02985 [Thermoguttaceae bacterium]